MASSLRKNWPLHFTHDAQCSQTLGRRTVFKLPVCAKNTTKIKSVRNPYDGRKQAQDDLECIKHTTTQRLHTSSKIGVRPRYCQTRNSQTRNRETQESETQDRELKK